MRQAGPKAYCQLSHLALCSALCLLSEVLDQPPGEAARIQGALQKINDPGQEESKLKLVTISTVKCGSEMFNL